MASQIGSYNGYSVVINVRLLVELFLEFGVFLDRPSTTLVLCLEVCRQRQM